MKTPCFFGLKCLVEISDVKPFFSGGPKEFEPGEDERFAKRLGLHYFSVFGTGFTLPR